MDYELTIATRWPDFDALGHLNHAVYHVYLDEARDDALRKTVGDFSHWPNVVVHASIDYRSEVPLGTREVTVRTRITRSAARASTSSKRFRLRTANWRPMRAQCWSLGSSDAALA